MNGDLPVMSIQSNHYKQSFPAALTPIKEIDSLEEKNILLTNEVERL